jgi:AcrR family transcriptional regulator
MKNTQTKGHILKESQRLFAKQGFSAVSMQDIAKAVGVKKASLYYFFESKDHIFSEVMNNFWEKLAKNLEELGFGKSYISQKDAEYFAGVLEHFLLISQYGGRAMAEVAVMKRQKELACKATFKNIDKCRQLLYEFLKNHSVPDPEIAEQIIANAIHMYIIHSQFEKPRVSKKAYAIYLAKLFIK